MAVLGDNPANEWEEEWRALREIGDIRAGTTFLFSFRFWDPRWAPTVRTKKRNNLILMEAQIAIIGHLLDFLRRLAVDSGGYPSAVHGNGDGNVRRIAFARG